MKTYKGFIVVICILFQTAYGKDYNICDYSFRFDYSNNKLEYNNPYVGDPFWNYIKANYDIELDFIKQKWTIVDTIEVTDYEEGDVYYIDEDYDTIDVTEEEARENTNKYINTTINYSAIDLTNSNIKMLPLGLPSSMLLNNKELLKYVDINKCNSSQIIFIIDEEKLVYNTVPMIMLYDNNYIIIPIKNDLMLLFGSPKTIRRYGVPLAFLPNTKNYIGVLKPLSSK